MKKISIILTTLLLVLGIAAVGNTEVLYENNFSEGDLSDWVTLWPDRGHWAVEGGTLRNTALPAQYITLDAIILPDKFAVQFDIKMDTDGGYYCVLSFYLPWANHHRPGGFQVWNNGMRGTSIGDCVDFAQTLPSGDDPYGWHHFEIVREEDWYSVY
ncbi:MAG: hypothetical protein JSU72_08910 [Deltaproteobacteria bacterium]|nr:MAG: hypothetical protein JSU72_08910 [Deltaproteobacteria bacterium]